MTDISDDTFYKAFDTEHGAALILIDFTTTPLSMRFMWSDENRYYNASVEILVADMFADKPDKVIGLQAAILKIMTYSEANQALEFAKNHDDEKSTKGLGELFADIGERLIHESNPEC